MVCALAASKSVIVELAPVHYLTTARYGSQCCPRHLLLRNTCCFILRSVQCWLRHRYLLLCVFDAGLLLVSVTQVITQLSSIRLKWKMFPKSLWKCRPFSYSMFYCHSTFSYTFRTLCFTVTVLSRTLCRTLCFTVTALVRSIDWVLPHYHKVVRKLQKRLLQCRASFLYAVLLVAKHESYSSSWCADWCLIYTTRKHVSDSNRKVEVQKSILLLHVLP